MLRLLHGTRGVSPNLGRLSLLCNGKLPSTLFSDAVRFNSQKSDDIPEIATNKDSSDLSVPWYLREDVATTLVEAKEVEIPEIPANAPPQVKDFLDLLAKEYGMDSLLLFDMADLDETHEFRTNNKNVDYIIVSTGKSERHIYKAANEMRIHLKHKYNTVPLIEGMVSSAKTPAMRRRLLRRARKGPLATDNEYGRSANSWVLCHHENVDVHMLTKERRQELNLESLWCKAEDAGKFSAVSGPPQESDNIFSGIRRFHTMTPFTLYQRQFLTSRKLAANAALEQHMYNLESHDANVADAQLEQMLSSFEHSFQNPSIQDHQLRFRFLKTMYTLRPSLVSFEQVEDALLAKYALFLEPANLAVEKQNDVTEYAKLLVDSPLVSSGKETCDELLHKLSGFIDTLYRFSNDKFLMSANAQFIPLLWRLTYLEHSEPVSLKMVDNVIHNGEPIQARNPEPSVTLASNKARDVLWLIEYYNEKMDAGSVPTAALRELFLFTYGNSGHWAKFWAEWDSISFSRQPEPAVAVEKWVRLCVYLCLRNDRSQILHFLNRHWDSSSTIGGSFLKSFRENGERFNSDNERDAFRKAIFQMTTTLSTDSGVPFEGARSYVAEL